MFFSVSAGLRLIRNEYREEEEEEEEEKPPTTLRITIRNYPSESRDVIEVPASPILSSCKDDVPLTIEQWLPPLSKYTQHK